MTVRLVYDAIAQQLSTHPDIKYVGLFNGQFTELPKHIQTAYPACYIRIEKSNVSIHSQFMQTVTCTVTVYLAVESIESYKPQVLDLIESVENYLTGCLFSKEINGQLLQINKTPMIPTGTAVDYDHGNLIVHTLQFNTAYQANYIRERQITIIEQFNVSAEKDTDI